MTGSFSRREFLKIAGATAFALASQPWNVKTLATPGMPNVLLIVLDTVRYQNLSLAGYQRLTTPNIDKIAKKGVVFEKAFSTAPWTLPSHASMFTGRWHFEQSTGTMTPLDNTYPTLAEALSAFGYQTGGFVANTILCNYELGLNRGFHHYEDFQVSIDQILLSPTIVRTLENKLRPYIGDKRLYTPKTAGEVNADFLRWLTRHRDRPFFAFLNYFDAHDPYLPPKPFPDKFKTIGSRKNRYKTPVRQWSPADTQAELDAYDGAIAYLDFEVGNLYQRLEDENLLENTLIIITSDHGEQFGEHQLFGHANSLYIQALHVPLVILYPQKIPANLKVPFPVSLRDIPATVFDVATGTPDPRFPGETLSRFWTGFSPEASSNQALILSEMFPGGEYVEGDPIEYGPMKSLIHEKYHYILRGDGVEELYDIDEDKFDRYDYAGLEDYRLVLNEFRSQLSSIF